MPHISTQPIVHSFAGGWATDYGLTYYGAPQQGALPLPWLYACENTKFNLGGVAQKFSGTSALNLAPPNLYDSSAGSSKIFGFYDYWRMGASLTGTQKIVAKVGIEYYEVSTNAASKLVGTATTHSGDIPHFSTFNDLLIIATNNSSDNPYSWDQTTFQNLAGSPPRFSFSVNHKGKQWAAGVTTAPSRLYYSVTGNPEDWTNAGSGSIDIDPGDGDGIVGLWSWKDELWVFKGPNRLSIHRITGSSPSDYARKIFVRGIGAAGQSCIFQFGDDIGFWSPRGSCHSLKATDTFGDYTQAFLNYPILSWCRKVDNLNNGNMLLTDSQRWQAVTDPLGGYTLLAYSDKAASGSDLTNSTNNRLLMMDWKFVSQGEQYPRFSKWNFGSFSSIAYGIDPASPSPVRMMGASHTGTIYKFDTESYTHDGSAIRYQVSTPYLSYGNEYYTKSISDFGIGIEPTKSSTVTVNWGGPQIAKQSTTLTQTATHGLGVFVLGTDLLGDYANTQTYAYELTGDYRSIQYDIIENTNETDFRLYNFTATIAPTGASLENA